MPLTLQQVLEAGLAASAHTSEGTYLYRGGEFWRESGLRKPERVTEGLPREGWEHDQPCFCAYCYRKGQGRA